MAQDRLSELYQKVILRRSRQPEGERAIEAADFAREAFNPLCGDQIEVSGRFARQAGETILEELGFQAQACSIVRASADVMVSSLQGQSVTEARAKVAEVIGQLRQEGEPDRNLSADEDLDLAAILGVRALPGRIKCATLPWEALAEALASE